MTNTGGGFPRLDRPRDPDSRSRAVFVRLVQTNRTTTLFAARLLAAEASRIPSSQWRTGARTGRRPWHRLDSVCADGHSVHYCTPSTEALEVVQKHFGLRRLDASTHPFTVNHFAAAQQRHRCGLPVRPVDGFGRTARGNCRRDFRVLKPGGKVIAALPAKYDRTGGRTSGFPGTAGLMAVRKIVQGGGVATHCLAYSNSSQSSASPEATPAPLRFAACLALGCCCRALSESWGVT